MSIEVNGRQHFEFVAHFHTTLAGYRLQQKNYRQKKEWLHLNGIRLVELNYDETEDQWKTKLKHR